MAISRRLPRSEAARNKALTKAKSKNDSIAIANQFLSVATRTRLNTIQPLFASALQRRGSARALQAGATTAVVEAFIKTKMIISHFIQVFNLGVARGKHQQEHRAFYQLDISSNALPSLATQQDVSLWGNRIVEGDTARIAAGGTAMTDPSAVEVAVAVTDYDTKIILQSGHKDYCDKQSQAVLSLHEEAQKVIKKVWDEVETYYNEKENSSKRRRCREWGIVYISDIEQTFLVTLLDSTNASGIDNANVLLQETVTTTNTTNGGKAMIKNTLLDEATFLVTHPNYRPQTIVVAIPKGNAALNIKVLLVPV